jgi:hypothetical protein
MASITIRDLGESVKRQLRLRAAQRNRSMEDEAGYFAHGSGAGACASGKSGRCDPQEGRTLGGRRAGAAGARTDAGAARLHMIILDTSVLSGWTRAYCRERYDQRRRPEFWNECGPSPPRRCSRRRSPSRNCSRGAALAARNVGDFAGCRLELIDPWV